MRIDNDKVLEETHHLFSDLSERVPYIKRKGIASLTQILADNNAKLASFKAESIVEDRLVRERGKQRVYQRPLEDAESG